jgi:lysophospholipase L1-like esterase
VITATSRSEPSARVAPRRYVALGDSLSAGLEGETPWPELAAAQWRQRNPQLAFTSLARFGVTSHEVERSQLDRALALHPDLVSIVCGANDVLESVRPDAGRFARTLDALLTSIRAGAPGALVATATYPATAPRRLRARSRRRVQSGLAEFNQAIRRLSSAHGAICLDWATHAEVELQSNYAADGFHPSPAAHRIAAREFVAAVDAALAHLDRQEPS